MAGYNNNDDDNSIDGEMLLFCIPMGMQKNDVS